jgi:hypothetical protein
MTMMVIKMPLVITDIFTPMVTTQVTTWTVYHSHNMESWEIFFNSANEEKLLQIIAEGERGEGGW